MSQMARSRLSEIQRLGQSVMDAGLTIARRENFIDLVHFLTADLPTPRLNLAYDLLGMDLKDPIGDDLRGLDHSFRHLCLGTVSEPAESL